LKALVSWSGGKDSCFALMQAKTAGYKPAVLFNVMNEQGNISRSHGLPLSVLTQQATAMGIPLVTIAASWEAYEANYIATLQELVPTYHLSHAIFGDIDLEAHRSWEEKVCAAAGISAVLPLWQGNRKALVLDMLKAGIITRIVSCNTHLGTDFLGRTFDEALLSDLEEKGVDVCGENGEFHTAVIDCPLFKSPVQLPPFTKVIHGDYCFLQWEDTAQ
jgi:diphthine-ammonia ligase